ncbi:unnamed protein product [Caenorhabditis auriculariae]|uniref:Uncharacterized protein n=1 Tax=Caenorhabditis auriculariae TaxID=2777116 RepID=A0A8S1HCM5_9PELO|nr:unnamed protein product [Caenorhabditis auriculariae]
MLSRCLLLFLILERTFEKGNLRQDQKDEESWGFDCVTCRSPASPVDPLYSFWIQLLIESERRSNDDVMMSLRNLFLFCVSVAVGHGQRFFGAITDVSPDCDSEFARLATQLASSKVEDRRVVGNIQAILASCNKSPIQKLTEVSVYMLDKGTISPKVMQQMKDVYQDLQKKKMTSLQKYASEIPQELREAVEELKTIATSPALSGNERTQRLEQLFQSIPPQSKLMIQEVLQMAQNTVPQEIATSTVIEAAPAEVPGIKISKVEPPVPEKVFGLPASFPIEKEQLLFSSARKQGLVLPIEETQTIPQRNVPPDSLPVASSSQNAMFPHLALGSEMTQQLTRDIGGIVHSNAQNVESFFQKLVVQPSRNVHQIQAQNTDRPLTVGTVDHSKNNIEDANLLNPRKSLWTDAAEFLTKSTKDLPSKLSELLQQQQKARSFAQPAFVPNQQPTNTFPLPAEAYQHMLRNGVEKGDVTQWQTLNDAPLLPSRPMTSGRTLDSYDTHVGRFASTGPANRYVLPSNLAELQLSRTAPNPSDFRQTAVILGNQGSAERTVPGLLPPPQIIGNGAAPPTVAPIVPGYPTYPPPPQVIVPTVVNEGDKLPEEITGTYRQQNQQINQRLPNGQMRNVHIDLWNEH